MWETFIARQIKRCNRNLLMTNALLLVAVALYTAGNSRYLANFVAGAAPISNEELARITNPDQRFRYFVRVSGGESIDTGVQSIEQKIDKYTRQVKSEKVTAKYVVIPVGQKLLIVKASPEMSGTTFKGSLETLPPALHEKIVAEAVREQPELEGAFIPAVLNAHDYTRQGWLSFGIGIPLLALIGWNLWKWNARRSDPMTHPIYKRLRCFGDPTASVQDIETLVRMSGFQQIGKMSVGGDWLYSPHFFGLHLFRIQDVVWMYQKVTKHYTYFIPTGKTFAIVVRDRFGCVAEVQGKKEQVESAISHVAERCPWAVVGFSPELETLWNKDQAGFISGVGERRKEQKPKAAAAAATSYTVFGQ